VVAAFGQWRPATAIECRLHEEKSGTHGPSVTPQGV
jgi:hypothetical protein